MDLTTECTQQKTGLVNLKKEQSKGQCTWSTKSKLKQQNPSRNEQNEMWDIIDKSNVCCHWKTRKRGKKMYRNYIWRNKSQDFSKPDDRNYSIDQEPQLTQSQVTLENATLWHIIVKLLNSTGKEKSLTVVDLWAHCLFCYGYFLFHGRGGSSVPPCPPAFL